MNFTRTLRNAKHIEMIYPYYRYNNRTGTAVLFDNRPPEFYDCTVDRLLQYGAAERVLFLVDTRSLVDQAYEAFYNYAAQTPMEDAGEFLGKTACERSSSAVLEGNITEDNADTTELPSTLCCT